MIIVYIYIYIMIIVYIYIYIYIYTPYEYRPNGGPGSNPGESEISRFEKKSQMHYDTVLCAFATLSIASAEPLLS